MGRDVAQQDRPSGDQEAALRRNVAKLSEINRALMQRVEHSLDMQGNAYQLFQTAILLDQKVRDRTKELEHALQAVEQSNLELSEAIVTSRTAQNRLQDAIDSISEGFAIFDPDDRLILFNRRFLDFWPHLTDAIRPGVSLDALVRLGLDAGVIQSDGLKPERWIAERRLQRASTRGGGAQRWVYALADGRWVQVNDRRSTEGGIASIYTDITDLKDAERQEREKALAERSAHLQATLESMSIGVAVFDRDQHLVTANRRYGELLELPTELRRAGSSYRRFQEFNDSRGAPALGTASPIGPGSARGSGPPAEVALNGRWFEVKGDPMPDGGFVTSYVEITERKLAEEALLDSEQRIRLFANAVPTMISYVDRDQRYRFVNRAYRAGYAPNGTPILGQTLHSVLGEAEYALRRPFLERALAGTTVTFDLPLRGSETEPRFGFATYVPHRNHRDEVVGFFTLIQDITERRRAERILEAANEELERRVHERTATLSRLNETLSLEVEKRRRIARELRIAKIEAERANISKTKFLADASHDLLQPLNAARLFVATLEDATLPPGSEALLGKIDHALENVEDLLNILLDISKLDAGRVGANLQNVPLPPLMEALHDEIAPLAERKGVTFTLLPCSVTVCSDPQLLRRLLQNFLTNAVRYTPAGRILFGARRRGDKVELQVVDTGVGIPQERLDEIFEEFRRLDTLESGPKGDGGQKGYGLGLSIVRRISRLLGYEVRVRSAVGRGSSFSVLVPVADPALDCMAPRPAATTIVPSAVDRVRVLVIDNDPAILDGMTRLLRGWGCQVAAADDRAGAEARIRVDGFRPDIVLADYHLDHGQRGTELIIALRHALNEDIPAAVITADRSPELQTTVNALSAVSLLTKPIKPARLRALIASARR
jgi:PAS domain S-box-containing protein